MSPKSEEQKKQLILVDINARKDVIQMLINFTTVASESP